MKNIIRVYIKSYDFKILNKIINKLKIVSYDNKVKFSGPIFLPIKKEIFNILRSPHVNKDSRDQFQISTHKRLMIFFNVISKFIIILRDSLFYYSLDFNFRFFY
ncbi:30S ribosomal protein S10 [Candidatus Nasuia deltocephalinicola]|uniref:30S ribosomal protein S10 n=1 Tax=Candidatus Nasuia deltocephalincola TaxID=1160784 RepID=UPI00216AF9F6|nr:30S ribosomal protein S10 [Candidatus Nasuia deltocephalinicola]